MRYKIKIKKKIKLLKVVVQCVPSWPELDGYGFAELAEIVGVIVVLITDEEYIMVFGILFSCLVRKVVSITKYKVNSFPTVVKILLF